MKPSAKKKPTINKEASTMAGGNVKGFAGPLGGVVKRTKGKKKKINPSAPYGDADLFEMLATYSLLYDKPLSEVVKKKGTRWTVVDDKTGVALGSYDDRKTAWEKQRIIRQQKKSKTKIPKPKPKDHPTPKNTVKIAPKAKLAPIAQVAKEQFMKEVKKSIVGLLSEGGSMISYVFEQAPTSEDSISWEKFISKLSPETILADPKLKSILKNVAKIEIKILSKSLSALSDILASLGSFEVIRGSVDQDENNDLFMGFAVKIEGSNQKLNFGIKLENGRPLILFPEETRHILNSTPSDESKLLRAEMMHIQETVFDDMSEVVDATAKRDKYLKNVELKIDKAIDRLNPLEIAVLKNLLKNKYKGVR
jgi:hypothetical protein